MDKIRLYSILCSRCNNVDPISEELPRSLEGQVETRFTEYPVDCYCEKNALVQFKIMYAFVNFGVWHSTVFGKSLKFYRRVNTHLLMYKLYSFVKCMF